MTLAGHVHELTRPHLPPGATLGAEPVPSLLDQLRAAVHPGNDGGAAGASAGRPVPVNVTAVDLQRRIDAEARDYQTDLIGNPGGRLEAIMQSWAESLPSTEWEAFLEHVTMDWCDQIRRLLHPAKPRRRLHQPCPSCGVMFTGEKRTPALSVNCWGEDEAMLHPQHWDAACAACGATWEGDELAWLREALAA